MNWIGASCLAAYILHTQAPVMGWIIGIDEKLLLTNNAWVYSWGAIGVTIAVFVVAILLDKVRIWSLMSIVEKIANVVTKKVYER